MMFVVLFVFNGVWWIWFLAFLFGIGFSLV